MSSTPEARCGTLLLLPERDTDVCGGVVGERWEDSEDALKGRGCRQASREGE